MTQDEAEALAAQREKNKSKHMTNKVWRAMHTDEKGWHVALVDSPQQIAQDIAKLQNEAREVFHNGGTVGQFNDICSRMFDRQMEGLRNSLGHEKD